MIAIATEGLGLELRARHARQLRCFPSLVVETADWLHCCCVWGLDCRLPLPLARKQLAVV